MASDTASGSNDSKLLGRVALLSELYKGILGSLWVGQLSSGDGAGSLVVARRIELGGDVDDPTLEALNSAVERGLGLEHDNLISLVEACREGKELVAVSHYQPAEPLRAVLRLAGVGRKPVPPAIATRIALDLLEGCAYLHVNEVLAAPTPDNVLLGSDGVTRVLEPVLSQVAATEVAWKEQPKRVTYAAPEQLGDEPGDARSDVFSVGVLVWEMLRNRPLFGGANFEQAAERVRTAAIGRADALKPAGGEQTPKPLADVVERALSREVESRFASADEMLESLRACKAATHAEVARYAKELLGDAFAAQERKVAAAKPTDAPAKPSPPRKSMAVSEKPKLPPRMRNITMPVDPEDLISVAPLSSASPSDEPEVDDVGATSPSDPGQAPAEPSDEPEVSDTVTTSQWRHGSLKAPRPDEPEVSDTATTQSRRRQEKRTLVGMAAPVSRPAAALEAPPEEPTSAVESALEGDDGPVGDLQHADAPVAAKGSGFDVMSIADDPSDPDGMDVAAAEALERVRKSQEPVAAMAAKFTPVVRVAEAGGARSGIGKLIAAAAVVLLIVVGAFAVMKRGAGEATTPTAKPTSELALTAAPTPMPRPTATATVEAAPTAPRTAEPTAAATAEAPSAPTATAASAVATAVPAPLGPTAAPVAGPTRLVPAPVTGPRPGPARPKFTPTDL
ncbi:MAG: protein kinase [Deltaproteobacteria bacterium]|nr:protein kinase [Deltaproteobacteria bacterium]